MAIRENTTVKITAGFYEGKTGKVVNTYPDLGVAIVVIDDSERVVKAVLSTLEEIKPPVKEVEPRIPEGAKQISRADYDAALIEATIAGMNGKFKNPTIGIIGAMTGSIVGEFIGSDIIFKDSDVVTITEDQLILDLWEGCNPRRVSEIVYNDMSLSQTMSVSIAAFTTLRKIPWILFGAEND